MAMPAVWTEREGGDWEACVISSYLIGLVYGGLAVFPLGIYSQAEREALEKVADEPQDYYTTDAVAQARYGIQLRKLSTGSIPDAVTRVGVGLVLAGYGALLIPTTAPIHSVFYLPVSATAGLVFDPLAVNQSAGVSIAASQIVAWSKGAGPNDAREVKENEFAMNTPGGKLAGPPIGTFEIGAGHALIKTADTTEHYQYRTWPGGRTTFAVIAAVDLTSYPAGAPVDIEGNSPPRNGRDEVFWVSDPDFGCDVYALRQDGVFTPTAVSAPAPADCGEAVRQAVADRDTEWVTKLKNTLHP